MVDEVKIRFCCYIMEVFCSCGYEYGNGMCLSLLSLERNNQPIHSNLTVTVKLKT